MGEEVLSSKEVLMGVKVKLLELKMLSFDVWLVYGVSNTFVGQG
jgi:hypothetical protein